MGNELKELDNLELKSFEQVFELAEKLASSKGFLPKIFEDKPGTVLACILKGRELGFSMMASFSALYVVPTKGGDHKIGIYADAMSALLQIRGYQETWITTTDKKATVQLSKDGEEFPEFSFTMEEAKTAGLAGKDNWSKYPKSMLIARARAGAARLHAPKVMHGLYTKEELEDMQPEEKVIQVPADNKTGNEMVLARIKAKHEEPQEPQVILEGEIQEVKGEIEGSAQQVNVSDDDGVLTNSFVTLNDMMDEAKLMDDLMSVAAQIKDSDLSEKEKEILRAKFSERKEEITKG